MNGAQPLLDAVLKPTPDLIHVEVDGETVVFHPERASLTVLDAVGTVVWACLDGTVSVRTLCGELAEAYQAPVAQVQADVLRLVAQLQNDRLLAAG